MRGRGHARKTHSLVLLRHSSFHDGYDDKDHTFLQMYSHHGIVLNCVALSVYHRRKQFASIVPCFTRSVNYGLSVAQELLLGSIAHGSLYAKHPPLSLVGKAADDILKPILRQYKTCCHCRGPNVPKPPLRKGEVARRSRIGEVTQQNAADFALFFGESVISTAPATSQSASLTAPPSKGSLSRAYASASRKSRLSPPRPCGSLRRLR